MKNRPPCEHGDLCHAIWKRTHYIYSIITFCPRGIYIIDGQKVIIE